MNTDIIFSAISSAMIGFAVVLVMNLLKKASKENAILTDEGHQILKMPILYGIFGIISFMLGLVVICLGIIMFDSENIYPQFFMFLLFSGLGIPLILQAWVAKTILTDTEIIKVSGFGKRKSIKWKDIQKVTFGKISLELKIQDQQNKIKCHQHLVGFHSLVEKLEEETGMSQNEMGLIFN